MSSRLNSHEELKLVLLVVLLDLFDLARVLKLILSELFLEEVANRKPQLCVLRRHIDSQFRLAFSLFGFLEVHGFRLEETVQFLRHELGSQLVFNGLLDETTEGHFAFSFLDGFQHQILIMPNPTLILVLSLLLLEEWGLLLLGIDRRLDELSLLRSEIPHENTF
jgi:hypothetical protein